MLVYWLDLVLRWTIVAAFSATALVALTHWAVRRGHLNPFGAWPRLVRRLSDPVVVPMERRLLRAGGNPQAAPFWLMAVAVAGGLVLLALLRWLIELGYRLGALAQAGPFAILAQCIDWTFALLMLALFVRVVASWLGISPYARPVRVAAALTDWFLAPIRRIVPPFGMLDLSPLVAYLVLVLARSAVFGLLGSWAAR